MRASSIVVSIAHPNGRREEITVDSDSAIIGSGAHCEVRLTPEEAAVEHLFIQARQGAIFAQARTLSPPPTMNGLPFTHGRLLPESVVMVGKVGLSMSLLQISDEVEIGKRPVRKRNPRTYVLGAVGIPLGLFYIANQYQSTDSHVAMPIGVPELFASAETNCPQSSKEPGLGKMPRCRRALPNRWSCDWTIPPCRDLMRGKLMSRDFCPSRRASGRWTRTLKVGETKRRY